MANIKFKRVMLKLGGESLAGPSGFGIEPDTSRCDCQAGQRCP